MELQLISTADHKQSSISVSEVFFNREYNEALVHQVVTSYLSNARRATRAQKGRSDIAKSTRKPWRQKGTGRARAGMASSPIWRGGGKIFPNTPGENYHKKINKRMYRAGMSVILSQLIRDGRLSVIDSLSAATHKTKDFVGQLNKLGLKDVMIVTNHIDSNLQLSSRNIPNVYVTEVSNIDPVSLVRYERTLFTAEGIRTLEELLS
ncbi:MAG: 50S ribosomal protein L4 [Nitrosomonas sp.]|nr:MAG: 50S ribosomal protein L4 [Nitrosomonas sp.]